MTIADLKAIDSRLKRVAAGESRGEIYRHEYDPNKSRCHSVDCIALFNALFDPTPVDEAWLEELGFRSDGPQYSSISLGPVSWHHRFKRLVLFGEPIPQVTTRGQLLFLLLGLGVFDE